MDGMVTARMPQGKKEAGNSILHELGTNPSQFINDSYDYVIKTKRLPFENEQSNISSHDIRQALEFIESIPLLKADGFELLSDDEIRQARLIDRGLATNGDFE